MAKLSSERSYLFDNIKVLLIFCVVYSHFLRVSGHFELGSPSRMIYIICFTFMMQGFFFISGYFSKNTEKCRAKAVETFMLPYFVFTVLFFLERYLIFGNAHLQFITPTHAMWFLLAMFVYRFGVKTLAKIPFILPLSAVLYLLAGAIAFLGPEFALQRICSFFMFFMIGYFCRESHIAFIRRIPKVAMILPAAVLMFCSWEYAGQSDYSVEIILFKNDRVDLGLGLAESILTRTIMAIAALSWLVLVINFTPDRKLLKGSGLISGIGQNTMTVYLLHIFVRNIMKWVGANDLIPVDYGGAIYCLALLGLALLCIFLFSRPAVAGAYDRIMKILYSPFDKSWKYLYKSLRK